MWHLQGLSQFTEAGFIFLILYLPVLFFGALIGLIYRLFNSKWTTLIFLFLSSLNLAYLSLTLFIPASDLEITGVLHAISYFGILNLAVFLPLYLGIILTNIDFIIKGKVFKNFKISKFIILHVLITLAVTFFAGIPINKGVQVFDSQGYFYNVSRGLPFPAMGYSGLDNPVPIGFIKLPAFGNDWARVIYLPTFLVNLIIWNIISLIISLPIYFVIKNNQTYKLICFYQFSILIIIFMTWLNWN